jgi:GlcNAc-PI de-N-acetylase
VSHAFQQPSHSHDLERPLERHRGELKTPPKPSSRSLRMPTMRRALVRFWRGTHGKARRYLLIATDGAQGGRYTSIPRGPELARVRAEEARCATNALGIHPPVLLDFPDAKLGDYLDDPGRLPRLSDRILEELQRLRADALITWGPDGATGHPDHRIVSNVVTQLVRSGASGVPERVFYASLPAAGFQIMSPTRGAQKNLIPQEKYFLCALPLPRPISIALVARCHAIVRSTRTRSSSGSSRQHALCGME